MPSTTASGAPLPWRGAWEGALYGPAGFFRREAAADHFRTSVHGSDHLARALLALVDRHRLPAVVDVGAGGGELLTDLHALRPGLTLHGVEVAPRPAGLPAAIGWSPTLPASWNGLLVGHEWLDAVPCDVVEVDRDGTPRLIHVDPVSGEEHLGRPVGDAGAPAGAAAWLRRWWPLDGAVPGTRAEVGATRDAAWTDALARLRHGLAVAVDYGHVLAHRPASGSLRSYRGGRQVRPVPDGSCDVTADVAVDAVAAIAAARGRAVTLVRQRAALRSLGVVARRPPMALAGTDPAAYVAGLARASRAATLTGSGLGDFYWLLSGAGGVVPSV